MASASREEVALPNAQDVESGKLAFVIRRTVAPSRCAQLIAAAEDTGFVSDDAYFVPPSGEYVQNCSRALVSSEDLAAELFVAVRHMLPSHTDGGDDSETATEGTASCCGLSEQLRFLRYDCGDAFAAHRDGPSHWADGSRSHYSLILYLNTVGEDYEGGRTRFLCDGGGRDGGASSSSSSSGSSVVHQQAGDVLVFSHELLHDSTPVLRGRKYVLRTDVMYSQHAPHPQQSLLTPSEAALLVPVPEKEGAAPPQPRMLGGPPSCILPDLFLGDHGASVGYAVLVQLGITHVLNVKGGHRVPPPPYREQLAITSVPLSDFGDDDLKSRLPECFAVLEACRAAGGRCLVHCSQGVNRSASVVLAWLMSSARTRWSLAEAWSHVKSRRSVVSPHHLYFAQLQAIECDVHRRPSPSLSLEQSGIFVPPGITDEAALRAAAAAAPIDE